MKVLGLVLFAISTIVALPSHPRLSALPGEPSECIKECINGVAQYGHELSILKNPDLTNYFNKLDEVCEVISTAKQCVQNCGSVSNPFALESLNIVCQPESIERIAVLKQCMQYIDHSIDEVCAKECTNGPMDETDVTPKMNPIIEKANSECSTFKCMARCNVEVVAKECGKHLGVELQGLLQYVMDTQKKDLEKLNLIEAMSKTTPPSCSYLYDPSVLFGESKHEEQASATTPEDDTKTLYAQAQLQLILKQIELAEKQDHLIDRENAKLDMEMSYINHKAHQREQRIHAQGIPLFMPMEKMPKESMPSEVEAMPIQDEQHPHSEPSSSMEQSHPPMPIIPEEPAHSMPEEPSHPEPEASSMEGSHPSMPEEHSQQQHQPESMPKEQHMPRLSRGALPYPVEIDGIPMEFIPFGGQMNPMEAAMPRFF